MGLAFKMRCGQSESAVHVCCDGQVSRTRTSRLPEYLASNSSGGGGGCIRNGYSVARTQSADRRPVATTVVRHSGRSTDTPPSTSSDRSTSSTVDSDVTPTDTPPITTDRRLADRTSTKRATTRKTSQLRPPKTIVSRQRLERHSDGASTASLTRSMSIICPKNALVLFLSCNLSVIAFRFFKLSWLSQSYITVQNWSVCLCVSVC